MVGIQGVSGLPEPAGPRQTPGRPATPSGQTTSSSDGVDFSPEAAKAAQAQSFVAATQHQPDIRTERVEEARVKIEQGTHKLQEVVLQVAARVAQFVD